MNVAIFSKSEIHGQLHTIKSPLILDNMMEENIKVVCIQDQDELFFGSTYCEYSKATKQLVLKDMNIVIQPRINTIHVYIPHTDYFLSKYLDKNIESIYENTETFFHDILGTILDDGESILEHIMHDIQGAKRDYNLGNNPFAIMNICTNALLNLDTLNLVMQKMRHLILLIQRHIPQFKDEESTIIDQMNNLSADINYATTMASTLSASLRSLYSIKEEQRVHKVETSLALVFTVDLFLSTLKFLDIHFPFLDIFVGILSSTTIAYILYLFFRKE